MGKTIKFYLEGNNREAFQDYPGEEKEQCTRCKTVVLKGGHARVDRGNGVIESRCPSCNCKMFWVFKDRVNEF